MEQIKKWKNISPTLDSRTHGDHKRGIIRGEGKNHSKLFSHAEENLARLWQWKIYFFPSIYIWGNKKRVKQREKFFMRCSCVQTYFAPTTPPLVVGEVWKVKSACIKVVFHHSIFLLFRQYVRKTRHAVAWREEKDEQVCLITKIKFKLINIHKM